MPEILVALPDAPEAVPNVSAVRSTLLTSSIAALDARSLRSTWLAKLPPEAQAPLSSLYAGQWVPVDLALAHYRACDALGLSPDEQFAMGRAVAKRVRGTLADAIIRMSRAVGVDPWSVLERADRLHARIFQGGGIAVTRFGPKEAEVRLVQNPLVGIRYFRNGFRGLVCAAQELFARTAYVAEVPGSAIGNGVRFRVSWA